MPLFAPRKTIICPNCHYSRLRPGSSKCSTCNQELPVQYVADYDKTPPFFVQVVGWSGSGKTLYLDALTLMLTKMGRVWKGYYAVPATEASQERVQHIRVDARLGDLPPPTMTSMQEVYIMLLGNMPRWSGRSLITRDCAGEHFDTMTIPKSDVPFLIQARTTLFFISLAEMKTDGRTMDMLLNNYINTLLKEKADFKNTQRNIVVVLTKGDIIPNLPREIRDYLTIDPIWQAVNTTTTGQSKYDDAAMAAYVQRMGEMSSMIESWVEIVDETAPAFVGRANSRGIKVSFSIVSATGGAVSASNKLSEALAPRRVLDPYFWAMEHQKE